MTARITLRRRGRHRTPDGGPAWARLRARVTRRATGDRGATAVEAAFVIPILLLLVVGIIEFGLAFKDQLAITSAVRAGARIASSEPRNTGFAAAAAQAIAGEGGTIDLSDVNQLWVYKADSSGHPIGAGGTFSSCSSSCIQFAYRNGGFVQTGGSWPSTSQNACVGQEDSVGVYLSFTHQSITRAIFDTIGMHSYTVMRFEPIPALASGGCQ